MCFWPLRVTVAVLLISLVEEGGGHSPVVMSRLFAAVASLAVEHALGAEASVAVVLRLSCLTTCRIFLHWQADSQPLNHQGSP